MNVIIVTGGHNKMVMLCDKTDKADLPKFLNVIDRSNWIAEEKKSI